MKIRLAHDLLSPVDVYRQGGEAFAVLKEDDFHCRYLSFLNIEA